MPRSPPLLKRQAHARTHARSHADDFLHKDVRMGACTHSKHVHVYAHVNAHVDTHVYAHTRNTPGTALIGDADIEHRPVSR